MQRILYFNKDGFCTPKRDGESIFTMMCDVSDDFMPEGIAIEEFVCNQQFKITDGRHIYRYSSY